MKKIINTKKAPQPIGPYSQAVLIKDTLYTSGQIALDADSGELILDTIKVETTKVMDNMSEVLKAAGMSFENVVKSTIFLKDMNDFSKVNEVYGSFFSSNFPARETVEVSQLPKNANVEISVIAFQG